MKTSLLITQQARHRSDCDKGSQSEQQGSRHTGSPPFRGKLVPHQQTVKPTRFERLAVELPLSEKLILPTHATAKNRLMRHRMSAFRSSR